MNIYPCILVVGVIFDIQSEILILFLENLSSRCSLSTMGTSLSGSMPGRASLQGQFYGITFPYVTTLAGSPIVSP